MHPPPLIARTRAALALALLIHAATSAAATFVLDELRCIYCGMCEEACPVDAIELTHIYDLTGESRADMKYDREKLLNVFDQTKDDPRDPLRTRRGKLGPAADFGSLPTVAPATQVTPGDRSAQATAPGTIHTYNNPRPFDDPGAAR